MSRRKSRSLERIEYAAYRAVSALVRRASDESLMRWGTRFGALAERVLRRRNRLALENLRGVYPDKPEGELRAILAACWRHFGREMLAAVQTQTMSLEEIAERCPFEGTELLDEAASRGRGTILLSAHWGGWEIAGMAIMAAVRNVHTIVRPLDNRLLERDLQELRSRTGAQIIERRGAARPILKALAGNGVVVLLPDQAVQPREGILVPFLGRPAWTTTAPAKLAAKQGSAIVFAFCIPDGLRHRLEFEEPIYVDQLSEAERDPEALTRRINEVISRRIHARPELWLWMHDRWKGTAEKAEVDGV